ncbi:MAG: hypothetical protein K2G23_01880 [Muribaculaceae bacterium]|nr:hypothetical protein [Muribaculaceae bacterium]
MKKIGSVSEFGSLRDQELWLAYRRAIASTGVVSSDILYELTASSPASRFWVSERRASEVMGAMIRGISISFMSPTRQEMYRELFRRFIDYRAQNPQSSIYEATFNAVNSPAPKFYLTPKSVKVILYKYRAGRKNISR